jgi:hypothetical protein
MLLGITAIVFLFGAFALDDHAQDWLSRQGRPSVGFLSPRWWLAIFASDGWLGAFVLAPALFLLVPTVWAFRVCFSRSAAPAA